MREEMLKNGAPKSKLIHNCSGKHSAMLALCVYMRWSAADYLAPKHPLQKLLLSTVAAFASIPENNIIVALDGCGAPVFAMPIYNMALSYLNLLNPKNMPTKKASAAAAIVKAIRENPEMLAGRGEFCTELIKVTAGRLIAKRGADGIYCCGQRGGPAIALKIEDGNTQVLPQVLLEVLRQLSLLSAAEEKTLRGGIDTAVFNCSGIKTGERITVFDLR
jgi:L-asparaginase II